MLDVLITDTLESADLTQLLAWATTANDAYRRGEPLIPDTLYDQIIERIRDLDPNNPFLESVEAEPEDFLGKTVPLPARMLSTDKVYTEDKLRAWTDRVIREADEIGVPKQDIMLKMTPKFDGFAVYDAGQRLFTRGDGYKGSDISHIGSRGIMATSRSRDCPGELVIKTDYFNQHLAGKYENSRNVLASVIKEGELDQEIKDAVAASAIWVVHFLSCDSVVVDIDTLLGRFEQIRKNLLAQQIFDTDGVVIEVINEDVKAHMGATGHHHRWQVAYKENVEFHDIRVLDIQWQTAKTGRITPVVLLEPTRISGVTVSKATGHHCGNIVRNGIDSGAIVRVCRSGLVIPYISAVVKPVGVVSYPAKCPSCGADTEVRGDNLHCTNEADCPAQLERTIYHFFDTIGNCDGFGPSTIAMMCTDFGDVPNVSNIEEIYRLSIGDFELMGFGERTATNLVKELAGSLKRPIEDWRFLAAFSIPGLGVGKAEQLMKHHTLDEIFSVTTKELILVEGFGEKSADVIRAALIRLEPQIRTLAGMFTLKQTKGAIISSSISGKTVVFTGTMQKGSRDDMETNARRLGAKVSGSVSSKTDYLVCGANTGAAKTTAAEKHGVKILTEDEYLKLIGEAA
jgi:DNA ligase (NAD+)